jgi:VCBS repeat-containing protein
LHTDTTGDGTGGSVDWLFTVDNAAVAFLAPGESRVEHFLVTISDANGGLAQRDIAVTINGSYNDAPVTSNDFAYSQVDGISVNAPGVLGNDTDPEGNALAVSAVNGLGVNVGVPTAGTYGHLALFSDGHYGYVADNSGALALAPTGSHLHDIFSYTVSDGQGGTASAALDITLNRGPVANADVAGVSRGGLVSGNVLANDFDTDGDAIALAALNGGALGQQLHGNYGWLTLYSDGRYSYQSDGNARLPAHGVAQDKFTYAVTDTLGGTSTANLTVTTSAHGQAYFSGTPGQDRLRYRSVVRWRRPLRS